MPPPVSDASHVKETRARKGGRNLVRFTNCRLLLLLPSAREGSGGTFTEEADLLVDIDAGLIAAVVERDDSREVPPAAAADSDAEEKKEEDDECGGVRADDTVVETVNCRGGILSPGFIDIQINGAFGVDFSDPTITPAQLRFVARKLVTQGVTSFCPTLISCSRDDYRHIIPTLGALCEGNRSGDEAGDKAEQEEQEHDEAQEGESMTGGGGGGAEILGLHLEGPFFAPAKRGAHPAPHILDPSGGLPAVLDTYGLSDRPADDGVRIVTLAPEREGALGAAAGLAERGIVVAMGHTETTLEEAEAAVTQGGATLVTHLFNAMLPFHHREPGLVGILSSGCRRRRGRSHCREDGSIPTTEEAVDAALRRRPAGETKTFRRPYWSVIADGIHVHPCAIRMARCAHAEGAVLVTDAMAAMGLGDGAHTLGGTAVEIKGKRATVQGTDTLAGSVASMDQCVRCYRDFSGCGTDEALRAATLHPAKVIGIDGNRGRLAKNCYANLVLLDEEGLDVMGTWVRGKNVYQAERFHEKDRKRRRVMPTARPVQNLCFQ